jgi:hypothetical protein
VVKDSKIIHTILRETTIFFQLLNLKLLKAGNGDYLAKRWKVNDNEFLVAIIPLYRKFNITNDYLKNWWNDNVFPSGNITILEPNASLGIAVCAQDTCLLKLVLFRASFGKWTDRHCCFYTVSVVLFITFVYNRLLIQHPEVTFLLLYSFTAFVFNDRLNFPNAFIAI